MADQQHQQQQDVLSNENCFNNEHEHDQSIDLESIPMPEGEPPPSPPAQNHHMQSEHPNNSIIPTQLKFGFFSTSPTKLIKSLLPNHETPLLKRPKPLLAMNLFEENNQRPETTPASPEPLSAPTPTCSVLRQEFKDPPTTPMLANGNGFPVPANKSQDLSSSYSSPSPHSVNHQNQRHYNNKINGRFSDRKSWQNEEDMDFRPIPAKRSSNNNSQYKNSDNDSNNRPFKSPQSCQNKTQTEQFTPDSGERFKPQQSWQNKNNRSSEEQEKFSTNRHNSTPSFKNRHCWQNNNNQQNEKLTTPESSNDRFTTPQRSWRNNDNSSSSAEQFSEHRRRSFYNKGDTSSNSERRFSNRPSWPNSYNRNSQQSAIPKYNPELYEHGWLFQDQYLSNLSASLDTNSGDESTNDNDQRNAFRSVPIIFMFDLTPMAPFFTKRFCFSNHFPCERLQIDNVTYSCTEQYYMYYRAKVFNDQQAMSEIMSTGDPKQMKRSGSRVVGFDQSKWYKVAYQIMVIASVRKYEQNPALRRQLFETSGANLVETNPMDERWGIALSMDDWRIRDKKMWRGMNVLGRLLTMLRERLLERPEFADEREEMLIEIKEAMEAANAVGCLKIGIGRDEEDRGG